MLYSMNPSFLPIKQSFIDVGVGEIGVGFTGDVLRTNLGSCVGLIIYPKIPNKSKRIATLSHILLAEKRKKSKSLYEDKQPARYANMAIDEMIRMLEDEGYPKSRYEFLAKLTGGVKLLTGVNEYFDIGQQNVNAVKSNLKLKGITLVSEYTGGNESVTTYYNVEKDQLVVKPARKEALLIFDDSKVSLYNKKIITFDFDKFEGQSKKQLDQEDRSLDKFVSLIKKEGFIIKDENERRIRKRILIATKLHGHKRVSSLAKNFEIDAGSFDTFLNWLKRAKVFNEITQQFTPLIIKKGK